MEWRDQDITGTVTKANKSERRIEYTRLADLLGRKVTLSYEVTSLQNEPAVFVNRFWSNFYRTMLSHTLRSAMTKLLLMAIALSLFTVGRAVAGRQLNLVIAVDLTRSVAVHAPGQPSEFQKNIDAVTKLLAQAAIEFMGDHRWHHRRKLRST
jgi:hypothetical protein